MGNKIMASVRTGAKESSAPTKRINWLANELPDPEDQRKYAQDRCVVAITEAIGEAMESAGLSRAQLAAKLGTNRSHITKLLSGVHNMTLHSLADLLWACGAEVQDLDVAELGVVEVLDSDADWIVAGEEVSPMSTSS